MTGKRRLSSKKRSTAFDLLPEWESSYSALGMFYFGTGQISKAGQILNRYSEMFPQGSLKLDTLRTVLAAASHEEPVEPVTLSPQACVRFLQMVLVLADSIR
jgi:hypothetical protein